MSFPFRNLLKFAQNQGSNQRYYQVIKDPTARQNQQNFYGHQQHSGKVQQMGNSQMREIADHFPINLNNENPVGQPSPAVTPGFGPGHPSRTPPLAPPTPVGGQSGSHLIGSRDFLRTPGLSHTPGPSTPPVSSRQFLTNPMEQNYDQRLLEQQRLAEHRQAGNTIILSPLIFCEGQGFYKRTLVNVYKL